MQYYNIKHLIIGYKDPNSPEPASVNKAQQLFV